MYQIKLTENVAPKLDAAATRHIPFATALALTKTAGIAKQNLREEMMRVFDAPTPYALNSLRTSPATKTKLVATVHLKDEFGTSGTPAHKFLDPEIDGGPRRYKRFEIALERSAGKPAGTYAIPGIAAKKDRFGNIPAGEIRRLLSYLSAAEQTAGFKANTSGKKIARMARGTKTKRPTGFFVARPGDRKTGHLKPGIYQWTGFAFGRAIKPVMVFSKRRPTYKKRLPFEQTVSRTIETDYQSQFSVAMEYALKTAK